jgi:transcriptional regulator with XRE-family HTH domain
MMPRPKERVRPADGDEVNGSTVDVDLVPARRLGVVLRRAREQRGLTHAEVSARAGAVFTEATLRAVEDGDARFDAVGVDAVAGALDVEVRELVPARADLVIDLDRGTIAAGEGSRSVGGDSDEILAQYLALVYTLRDMEPGTPTPLREVDLAVLSRALQLDTDAVKTKLVTLMVEPPAIVSARTRLLRRKVIIPAAGILVGATAVGALVFILNDGSPEPVDTGSRVGQAVVFDTEVELISPLVVERGAEGEIVPSGSVELIPPFVVERGEDVPGSFD